MRYQQVVPGSKVRLLVDLEAGETVEMLPIYTKPVVDKWALHITFKPTRLPAIMHAASGRLILTTLEFDREVEVVEEGGI